MTNQSVPPSAIRHPPSAIAAPLRCLTIDVEEHYHIEAAHGRVERDERSHWPSRVEANMDRLLTLLAGTGCRATLFFLGEVAQQHPKLVRRCADAGHEIASHGNRHDRLHRLDPAGFRADVLASRQRLEDLIGQPVRGYRAPTWSLTRDTAWAVDVLAELGFAYDASVFPVRHPQYGVRDAPDRPFVLQHGEGASMLELPPLTWRIAGRRMAAAGGGYFRLLPLQLMTRALRQAARESRPAILYFHPWEFDPDQPRMPLGAIGRVRTYTGLRRSMARLETLLRLPGTWRPIADDLPTFAEMANERPAFPV